MLFMQANLATTSVLSTLETDLDNRSCSISKEASRRRKHVLHTQAGEHPRPYLPKSNGSQTRGIDEVDLGSREVEQGFQGPRLERERNIVGMHDEDKPRWKRVKTSRFMLVD